MRRLRMAALISYNVLLGACDSGGGGATTAPETPVAWRGATIQGERPQSGLDEVEAGWQQALALVGGGPEPQGWIIEFRRSTTEVLCLGEVSAGCFDPQARFITLAWGAPDWPGGRYPAEVVIDTAAHEFCHYLRYRRGGNGLGPWCLTERPRG